MLYMSDDKKRVFKTEQECYEYEQHVENQRIKRDQLEMDRQNRLNNINKKYEELQSLIFKYEKDYGIRQRTFYLVPIYDLVNILCG